MYNRCSVYVFVYVFFVIENHETHTTTTCCHIFLKHLVPWPGSDYHAPVVADVIWCHNVITVQMTKLSHTTRTLPVTQVQLYLSSHSVMIKLSSLNSFSIDSHHVWSNTIAATFHQKQGIIITTGWWHHWSGILSCYWVMTYFVFYCSRGEKILAHD